MVRSLFIRNFRILTRGIPENGHDNHIVMPDVQSDPDNTVRPVASRRFAVMQRLVLLYAVIAITF